MSTLKENVHDLFDGWNTIPNWLSFIRIALIPVFAVLFVQGASTGGGDRDDLRCVNRLV